MNLTVTVNQVQDDSNWLDELTRWALNEVPQVVQMGGGFVVMGVLIGFAVVVYWKGGAILAWWGGRGRRFKGLTVGLAGLCLIGATSFGLNVWDYTQHDNNFCLGCHIMDDPHQLFGESAHSDLNCHDCHMQSVFDSAYQLHLWVVNRPTEISEHEPVGSETCENCHVTVDPDSSWAQIAATAGHRLHLEADTIDLADVGCATCHGVEVHQFAPATETCGQSNCHGPERTEIVLGKMAGQTPEHCVVCHEFVAPVTEESELDTVRFALTPTVSGCLSCHEMEAQLVDFEPDVDPHDAVCGTCHNAHTQELPEAAAELCAECHSPISELSAFHQGLDDEAVENCVGCHGAHSFHSDASDCLACHADLFGGTPTAGPRRVTEERVETQGRARDLATMGPSGLTSLTKLTADPVGSGGPVRRTGGDYVRVYLAVRGVNRPQLSSIPQQDFSHEDHRDIECVECHSMDVSHGELVTQSCSSCHHSAPLVQAGCENCHAPGSQGVREVRQAFRLQGEEEPSIRTLTFDHQAHPQETCSSCHTSEGDGAFSVGIDCQTCHEDHHEVEIDCMSCHLPPSETSHTIEVHTTGCAGSGCHEDTAYETYPATRSNCLVCHQDQRDHEPEGECATCHRVSLVTAENGSGSGSLGLVAQP